MLETALTDVTRLAIALIDTMALVTIVYGTVEAFISGVTMLVTSRTGHERRDVWLRYARWLVAGLTFQLAADILETAITTSWEAVGRVGAIALIRTFLNYFLERDIEDVRTRQSERAASPSALAKCLLLGPIALVAAAAALPGSGAHAESDPLRSWNDRPAKQAIIAFVERVTKEDSADYVAPPARIATFDNDGTLWAEQPAYFQLEFVIDRVKALAPQNPEWATKEPFSSLLTGDLKSALATGEAGIAALMAATHSGMTTDEFATTVGDWIGSAKHPKTGRLYTDMVYQPMLELLAYLRANGFKTFIVSGGGIEFMRPWTERVYGIPPEQVVGSTGGLKLEMRDGSPVLMKLPELVLNDDKEGKPVGIQRHIGRRPIAAFGNSDGDLAMLQWTCSAPGARFCLYVHHTDAEREWAYDRASHIGKLDKGLDEATAKGWTVVDMKADWKSVFPPTNKGERP